MGEVDNFQKKKILKKKQKIVVTYLKRFKNITIL